MGQGRKIYFAYGSNTSVRRLRSRVPSATRIGVGRLADHELSFRKRSRDGSAKCDIPRSEGQQVLGVLFEIDAGEEEALDRFEGCGKGYRKRYVQVSDPGGHDVGAFTYYADSEYVDTTLKPYTWYVEHVLRGAEEAGLPESYVDEIQRVEAWQDSDRERETRELAIYDNVVESGPPRGATCPGLPTSRKTWLVRIGARALTVAARSRAGGAAVRRRTMTRREFRYLKENQIRPRHGWPATFSCNGAGRVWPYTTDGYTPENAREYMEGRLALLDEVVRDVLHVQPRGGRFQMNDHGAFVAADGRQVTTFAVS